MAGAELGRGGTSRGGGLTHATNDADPLARFGKGLSGQWVTFARQEGSHRSYVKKGISRPIVIPTYDEIPVSIIRNNLKTAGLSREDYFRLLEQI